MRYAGQNYELPVPLPDGRDRRRRASMRWPRASPPRISGMYGFVAEDEPVQLVTFRVEATGLVPQGVVRSRMPTPAPTPPAPSSAHREVWLPEAGGFVACPVYDRDRLRAGNRIAGPAIVEQMDATTVVLPGMVGRGRAVSAT